MKQGTIALLTLMLIALVTNAEEQRHDEFRRYAKFEMEQQGTGEDGKLLIEFPEEMKLLQIEVINIMGNNVGTFTFDGKKIKTTTVSIKDMPQGPHMFKFNFKGHKQVIDVFRVTK